MSGDDELRAKAARLEGQVAALEAALETRSRQLKDIVSVVSRDDLALVAEIVAGKPVDAVRLERLRRYYTLDWHSETTAFTRREVAEALEELWADAPGRPEALLGGAE